jgi:hypothetical protein
MKRSLCDGTGVAIPEGTPTTGFFGRQYSDAVRGDAEAYLRELDELHTKHAKAFSQGLVKLRAKWKASLATLPDEP